MTDYISKNMAVCIADYAADEHPYEKDPTKPDTFSEYNQGWNDACDYIGERLKNEKAADVMPVVRCKDCKFYKNHALRDVVFDADACHWNPDEQPDPDDFCSCYERIDDAEGNE